MPIYKTLIARCTVAVVVGLLASCGGGDGPSSPAPVQPGPGTGDFLTLSVNGGAQSTYAEASGLPAIDCDPRVDWAFNQIIGYANYTNGSGPAGYDMFFDVIFALDDTVGTYTVQGDFCQVLIYNGNTYTASPAYSTTSGTINVARADTRIEGTFNVTAVDTSGATLVGFSGSFGVEKGISLSCSN